MFLYWALNNNIINEIYKFEIIDSPNNVFFIRLVSQLFVIFSVSTYRMIQYNLEKNLVCNKLRKGNQKIKLKIIENTT